MDPDAYRRYTGRLTASLAADDRVVGLVATGSMAATDHPPDAWSDHDFWIVTRPGAQEAFRTDLTWLPDHEDAALVYRETAHGLKALLGTGHLVEYAVFDEAELPIARVNAYRVLIDRGRIAEQLAEIAAVTRREQAGRRPSDAFLVGQLLTSLLVGVGRYARGERLSAHAFVRGHAVRHLLALLTTHLPAADRRALDSLDPYRRFERVHPAVGARLDALLAGPIPDAAAGLLDLTDEHLGDRLADYPRRAVRVVRDYLASATT